MKNLTLLLLLILSFGSLSAQDIITKKDGKEIKAKVLEVDIDVVRYKAYDNLDGPVIIINKSDIAEIKFESGYVQDLEIDYAQDTMAVEEIKPAADYSGASIKGFHIAAFFTPGSGKIIDANFVGKRNRSTYSYMGGLNAHYFFNEYIGIGAGLRFLRLASKFEISAGQTSSISTSNIGFSVKFLLYPKTSGIVRFYMEVGPTLYFNSSSSLASASTFYFPNDVFSAFEINLGVNVNFTDRLMLQLGAEGHLSFYPVSGGATLGGLIGFHTGISYRLSK